MTNSNSNGTASQNRRLTILVVAADVVGRVNACAGITRGLLERGHRVVFFTESAMAGRMVGQGFEEFVYELNLNADKTNEVDMKPGQKVASGMFENRVIGPYEPLEKIRNLLNMFLHSPNAKRRMIALNECVQRALDAVKPTLILFDNTFLPPAIHYSGIPWIQCISTSPLYCILDQSFQVPPGGSGYNSTQVDATKWGEFNEVRKDFFYSSQFSSYLEEMGYAKYENDIRIPTSAMFTCYAWPEEINFDFVREERRNWFNFETFNRNWESTALEKFVPSELLHSTLGGRFSGKWIYLSMGTMGCVDVTLMRRLISMLADLPHKLLVSLGPKEHEIRPLPSNAYGARYLPQTALLPSIDLLITHGGNNTVTEALARAVPMLVLPLFADQYDNAQRLSETEFGLRLDPYQCTKTQLHEAIAGLLQDTHLKTRLGEVAKRIQHDNRHRQLHDQIEARLCSG